MILDAASATTNKSIEKNGGLTVHSSRSAFLLTIEQARTAAIRHTMARSESDVLLRSLQRALHRYEAGRRAAAGPLFVGESEDGDLASGTIYVLRSKSDNPVVASNRDVLHKIGVTDGKIETRIANAKLDPTFLMADVEIVATYKLSNINRAKLENLIHRIFDPARLDIGIKDRFGNRITPREWFLVPVFVIDEGVERIKDGTITSYRYNPKTASLIRLQTRMARKSKDHDQAIRWAD